MTAWLVPDSAVFDVGWGLAGPYPGPALVALGAGVPKTVGFVTAVLADMAVFSWLQRKHQTGGSAVNRPITRLQRTT